MNDSDAIEQLVKAAADEVRSRYRRTVTEMQRVVDRRLSDLDGMDLLKLARAWRTVPGRRIHTERMNEMLEAAGNEGRLPRIRNYVMCLSMQDYRNLLFAADPLTAALLRELYRTGNTRKSRKRLGLSMQLAQYLIVRVGRKLGLDLNPQAIVALRRREIATSNENT